MGSIITFYSFKGGVGRTMALANAACMLAKWGKKVLMVDWDLEAPGLEHFFFRSDRLNEVRQAPGLIELLINSSSHATETASEQLWKSSIIDLKPRNDVRLSLLTAGSRSTDYFRNVRDFDVESFYQDKNGGRVLERLRSQWKENFDFVLIDSRTGITDIGGVCTIQLPDILILVFMATEQSLCGAIEVADKAIAERQKLPFDRSLMPVLPLPSKFDTQTEHKISQKWLRTFAVNVSQFYETWLPKKVSPRKFLQLTKIPYITYFSFGEGLPVLDQGTSDPTSLGYAYETLAALIGNHLQNADLLVERRDAFIDRVRVGGKLPLTPLREIPARTVLLIQLPHGSSYASSGIESLKRYYELLADSAARFAGTIAMASDDTVLIGFSDSVTAIRCAIAIQEDLAVSQPILLDRHPLRPRMAIHSGSAQRKKQPTTKELFKAAVQISSDAKAGQILISAAGLDTIGDTKLDVSVIPLGEEHLGLIVEEPAASTGRRFEIVPIKKIQLKAEEREALFKQNPDTKQGGGFQAFLVQLQERIPPDSNELTLTLRDLERIARYAHDYRGGGWQARLRKIFGRTLGQNLGRTSKP